MPYRYCGCHQDWSILIPNLAAVPVISQLAEKPSIGNLKAQIAFLIPPLPPCVVWLYLCFLLAPLSCFLLSRCFLNPKSLEKFAYLWAVNYYSALYLCFSYFRAFFLFNFSK